LQFSRDRPPNCGRQI